MKHLVSYHPEMYIRQMCTHMNCITRPLGAELIIVGAETLIVSPYMTITRRSSHLLYESMFCVG
jgi:hypothetical protein